jgi:hypothetical protein
MEKLLLPLRNIRHPSLRNKAVTCESAERFRSAGR